MTAPMRFMKLTPEMASVVDASARDLEAFILGPLSDRLGAAYRFFQSLHRSRTPAVQAVLQSPHWPQEDVGEALRYARTLATVAHKLQVGDYELAPWAREEKDGSLGQPVIGVVSRGAIRTMGLWPLIPVLVIVAVGTALTGAWVLADLWLQARAAEAKATQVMAEADARFLDAIRQAKSEEERAQLTQALQAAKAAAAQPAPGWIARAGQALANLASDVVSAESNILRNFAEDTWPWAILILWLLYGRRRNERRA